MNRRWAVLAVLGVVVAALALFAVLRSRWEPFRISESEVREAVYAAIQQEADTSFLITGYIDVATTTRVENTPVLLPNVLGLRLGTTSVTVRVPGRVSYGFAASALRPEMIRVHGDTVDFTLPPLAVYSAEPDLAAMEVETNTGWARAPARVQETERQAIRQLSETLHRQGELHLQQTMQPRVNTARALQTMLTPVLRSAGMENPYFRILLGDGLVLEPE